MDGSQTGDGAARKLLVYVRDLHQPARLGTPSDPSALLDRLLADLGAGWELLCYDHCLWPWSTERLADAAHRLRVQIRTWAGDNGEQDGVRPVEEVLLLGHSVGGLLVRHAYLLDSGVGQGEGRSYAWTAKVKRMVLFAAPNAGFRTGRLPLWLRPLFFTAAAARSLTVEDLRAGSYYLTSLRLGWVDAFRDSDQLPPRDTPVPNRSIRPVESPPLVVQVLGDRDGLVTRDDSLDIEYMRNATQIDVPGATHASVVDLDPGTTEQDARACAERYAVLRRAVCDDLTEQASLTGKVADRPVYFVLHGIRTSKYANWVGQLTDELTCREPDAIVHVPSYGYFSAVQFALLRRRNIRLFLDWYGRAYVIENPNQFHIAGHSNGTYLLGMALRLVPAVRFERVYLAGSVLPRDFPWSHIVRRGQIGKRIHTDRATKDWAVGWLCAVLNGMGMHDIGTAGFTGFDESVELLEEHWFAFDGGHGAAVTGAERLGQVADFLTQGQHDREPTCKPAPWFELVGRLGQHFSLPILLWSGWTVGRWITAGNVKKRAAVVAGAGVVAWETGLSV